MNFLAISGSARAASTNTALLRALAAAAPPPITVTLAAPVTSLPVFSPDLETPAPPAPVRAFARAIAQADGLIFCSPEYARGLPGGLKNAIDWMVSRAEIIDKPIVLAHASHRGDDMLAQLRCVLATVSTGFTPDIFLRLPLLGLSPDEIATQLASPQKADSLRAFLSRFAQHCLPAAAALSSSGRG